MVSALAVPPVGPPGQWRSFGGCVSGGNKDGSGGSAEIPVSVESTSWVSVTLAGGLLTLANLAGSFWRTGDDEHAQTEP